MKIKSKLILRLVLLGAPLVLSAWTPEQAYIESYRMHPALPVPTVVVIPQVGAEYAGQSFKLRFVVDLTGRPRQIRTVTHGASDELVAKVSRVVACWKFKPQLVGGKPVARKVELPVEVIAPGVE